MSESGFSWTVVSSLSDGMIGLRGRDEDTRSEASSWDFANQSDASWDLVLERQSSVSSIGPRGDLERQFSVSSVGPRCTCGAGRHAGMSLVGLIRAGRWNCALEFLQTAPVPSEVALERDECGDSALAWAAYKSTSQFSACFELICALLAISPADIRHRSHNRFLPLHEAAWGNAPAAVWTLLAAAWPEALNDSVHGQTPHEVWHYYHHSRRLALRAPEQIFQGALELRAESQWLQFLSAVRLPPVHELRCMTVATLKSRLDVPRPIAALVAEFVATPYQTPSQFLPSIPECRRARRHPRGKSLPGNVFLHPASPKKRVRTRVQRPAMEGTNPDDVDHVREPCAKDCRRYAGLKRGRNTRCDFTQQMIVADGWGTLHRLFLHAVHTLPRSEQRGPRQRKWPPKAILQRDRAWERAEKLSKQERLVDIMP